MLKKIKRSIKNFLAQRTLSKERQKLIEKRENTTKDIDYIATIKKEIDYKKKTLLHYYIYTKLEIESLEKELETETIKVYQDINSYTQRYKELHEPEEIPNKGMIDENEKTNEMIQYMDKLISDNVKKTTL